MVLNKFVVNSSLGRAFDCAGLHDIRKEGLLKGDYSCQGETVAIQNTGARFGHDTKTVLLVLFLAGLFSLL